MPPASYSARCDRNGPIPIFGLNFLFTPPLFFFFFRFSFKEFNNVFITEKKIDHSMTRGLAFFGGILGWVEGWGGAKPYFDSIVVFNDSNVVKRVKCVDDDSAFDIRRDARKFTPLQGLRGRFIYSAENVKHFLRAFIVSLRENILWSNMMMVGGMFEYHFCSHCRLLKNEYGFSRRVH